MIHLTWMREHPQGENWEMWKQLPVGACYVDADAAVQLGKFSREHCGVRALLLSDENTRAVGGEAVVHALENAGKTFKAFTYPSEMFEATQERADEVGAAAQDSDFIVAVGAGTLCDLAKSAGTALGKPVLLYATAASMNGYTSSITALKVRGLKRTIPCDPALGVFADPAVVATAPAKMTAAGVADFLSKSSASADWVTAYLLRGEDFSRKPREMVEGIQERILESAAAVGQGNPTAIALVLEALLVSGFGMVLAGSSAPASGGEHLISHYLDMKHAINGAGNDLHGTQVGVATIYTLELWEAVNKLDPAILEVDALLDAQPNDNQVRDSIAADWGDVVGAEVLEQWMKKRKDRDALHAEVALFKEKQAQIQHETGLDLLPAETVRKCIETSGGPVRIEDTEASAVEFENAKHRARFIRNRFTVLDLAAELGLGPAGP